MSNITPNLIKGQLNKLKEIIVKYDYQIKKSPCSWILIPSHCQQILKDAFYNLMEIYDEFIKVVLEYEDGEHSLILRKCNKLMLELYDILSLVTKLTINEDNELYKENLFSFMDGLSDKQKIVIKEMRPLIPNYYFENGQLKQFNQE